MITDLYRTQNSPGELNLGPSMTEPARIYTVAELLARPELILSSRSGYSEMEVDINDPAAFDDLPDSQDVHDSWNLEIPRDPDLHNPSGRRKRPEKPNDAKAPDTIEHRSQQRPEAAGERRASEAVSEAASAKEEV